MARFIWLGCVAYLVVGFGQVVVGTIMEPMVRHYGIAYGDGGQLVLHQFLGGLVGTIAAPWLMRRVGRKPLLLFALALMAAVELAYLALPSWGVMLALAPLAGFGFGTTETMVGSMMIIAAGAGANVAMSRIEVFFGLGALLMPFLGAALIDAGHWRAAFGIVGALAAIGTALWLIWWPPLARPASGSTGAAGAADGPADRRPGGRRTSPVVWLCALFFLLYVGFEMSLVHYLPSLLVQGGGMRESGAALSLSLFWVAITIGRLVAGQLADRMGGAAYLLAMTAAAAVFAAAMAVWTGTGFTLVMIFASGLVMSGMFAIALVFANQAAAPGWTERTTSLMMTCGLLGGGLLPRVTGWFLDRYGPDGTRWLLAGMAAALLLAMAWAAWTAARRRTAGAQG